MNRRTALSAIATLAASACLIKKKSAGQKIYVTNEGSGDLSIIDAASLTVLSTLPLGKRPRGIQVSPDKRNLYIALSGSPFAGPDVDESKLPPPDRSADGIGVIDVATQKLDRMLRAGTDPEQLAVSFDGKQVYIANEDAAVLSVLDAATGSVVASIKVGDEPEGVAVRPDGRYVYVTSEADGSVYAIDAQTHVVAKRIEVGHRPRSIVFQKDGSRAFVSLERDAAVAIIDSITHSPAGTIVLGAALPVTKETIKPMGLRLASNEGELYVTTGWNGNVFVIDPVSSRITASIPVGGRPWGIAANADSTRLYTANGPTNDVSVVDVASRKVIEKVRVGDRPWGVAVV